MVVSSIGILSREVLWQELPFTGQPRRVSWLTDQFTKGAFSRSIHFPLRERTRLQWLPVLFLDMPFSSPFTVAGPLRILTAFRSSCIVIKGNSVICICQVKAFFY